MKFRRPLDEFRARLDAAGIEGDWRDAGDNKHELRMPDGSILNWWSHTGSISFGGPKSERDALEARVAAALTGAAPPAPPQSGSPPRLSYQVFVVHGHDLEAKDQLELVIHRLGLDPYVLMNTSGGGKTIIEALESKIGKGAQTDFGIVLVTPDDKGYAVRDAPAPTDVAKVIQPRARQNVILELGMLLSSLTRERVAVLVKGHVEMPSDFQGVLTIRYNAHVRETVAKLVERLNQCGIPVASDKIAKATS